MATSIWGGSTVVNSTANADNTYLEEAFDIVASGTVILPITKFTYALGTGSLDVFINGVRQENVKDYTETSSTSITVPGLKAGDRVVVRGLVGSTGATLAQASANASAEYAANSLASASLSLGYSQNSANSAAAAAVSAQTAANIAQAIYATSASSNAFSIGPKTFVTQTGKQFNPGSWVSAIPTTNNSLVMSGPITSYDPVTGVLVFNASRVIGAIGSFNSWNLSITGVQGVQGIQGPKGDGFLNYVKRSVDAQLVASNVATYFELSGTFTQTFDTPANLGNQWWCYVENAGNGEITIPASDGRTNWIVYPEEIRMFLCDGTAIYSKILRSCNFIGTVTGMWTKPPGYSMFTGYLYTGGASGEAKNGASAAGGPGGAYTPFALKASVFANTELVTVGAGGAGYANFSLTMRLGGPSSIGNVINLDFDGTITPLQPNPNVKYTSQTNQVKSLYMPGQGGTAGSGTVVYAPGTSVMGGQGGTAGTGGNAPQNPTSGTAPGGGGGGIYASANILSSGSGARGEVNIRGVL